MPWELLLRLLVLASAALSGSLADCPQICECKWRGGKESAICRAANLTAVPKELDAGTQLLDMSNNSIPSLGRDVFYKSGLVNLQKLYLSRCHLSTLDRLAFRHLINLVELDLSYNEMQSVPSHAFESISELRELILSGNPIFRITAEAFSKVPQLVRLELSDCRIGNVEVRAFSGLERGLEWLKLDHNRLVAVRPETFTAMQNLHGLELDGNPWNCSCALRPLRNWMLRKNVPSGVPPVCHSPPRLAGRQWDRLDLDEFACGPKVSALRVSTSGVEGNNVTLSCSVQGSPDPAVRWTYRNRAVANLSSSVPFSSSRKMFLEHTSNTASNLTILTLDAQDAGVYICSAENRAGKVEANITLTVSRRPSDHNLSGKVVAASIMVAILFVVASCLVALCLWSLRKRHSLWVAQTRGARLRHDDRYEKIEMNHKDPVSTANHTSPAKFAAFATVRRKCEAVEVSSLAHRRGGRKGRYTGIPTQDLDDLGYDGEVETPTASNTGVPWTATLRSSDDTISSSNPSEIREARGGGASLEASYRKDKEGVTVSRGLAVDGKSGVPGGELCKNGLGGGDTRILPQHVLRKQMFGDSGSSLYTSLLGEESPADCSYPDLLQPQADSIPSALGGGFCSGLGGMLGSSLGNTLIGGTLPRRPHARTHQRRGSESPLLTDSRYGSSGGSSSSNLAVFPPHYQRSSSSLNLASSPVAPFGHRSLYGRRNPSLPGSPSRERLGPGLGSATERHDRTTETPILAALSGTPGKSVGSRYGSGLVLPSGGGGVGIGGGGGGMSPNSYDYHAAQLERFVEEYRSLHDQLSKMKEICDSLRHAEAAQAANPKSILKKKVRTVSPDRRVDPPYWVPRSGFTRRYSGGDFYPS